MMGRINPQKTSVMAFLVLAKKKMSCLCVLLCMYLLIGDGIDPSSGRTFQFTIKSVFALEGKELFKSGFSEERIVHL